MLTQEESRLKKQGGGNGLKVKAKNFKKNKASAKV